MKASTSVRPSKYPILSHCLTFAWPADVLILAPDASGFVLSPGFFGSSGTSSSEGLRAIFYDNAVVQVLSVRPPDVAPSPPPVEQPTVAPCMHGQTLDRNYPDIIQQSTPLELLVRSRIFY